MMRNTLFGGNGVLGHGGGGASFRVKGPGIRRRTGARVLKTATQLGNAKGVT